MNDAATAEQAREYAQYWTSQVTALTGAAQAEARRSADYWTAQAARLSAPPATRRKLFTIPVIITLILVPILVAGVIVTEVSLYSQRAAAVQESRGPRAEKIATLWLDAVIARDSRTAKSYSLDNFSVYGSGDNVDLSGVIVGTPEAAASINLGVSYSIEDVLYGNWQGESKESDATIAVVVVRLSYSATVEGNSVKASGIQSISLKRDHFDAGTGENVGSVHMGSDGATVLGPWKVQTIGYTIGGSGDLKYDGEYSTSTYAASPLPAKLAPCGSPTGIMNDIANTAVKSGTLPAWCTAGYTKFKNYDSDVATILMKNLVPFDRVPAHNIVGLADWRSPKSGFGGPPFAELSTTLLNREFVFTMMLVDSKNWLDPEKPEYRIVSITERITK